MFPISEKHKIFLRLLLLAKAFVNPEKPCGVRDYLRDVRIDSHCNDDHPHCFIYATDGHMLIKITFNDYQNAVSGVYTTKSIQKAFRMNDISLLAESEETTLYPDLDRLIPQERGLDRKAESLPLMSAYLLAQSMQAMGDFFWTIQKHVGVDIGHHGVHFARISDTGCCVLEWSIPDKSIEIQIGIMPMRG